LNRNSWDGTVRYVPPSVEFLGPTTPSFQARIYDHQISNRIDAPDKFIHSFIHSFWRLI